MIDWSTSETSSSKTCQEDVTRVAKLKRHALPNQGIPVDLLYCRDLYVLAWVLHCNQLQIGRPLSCHKRYARSQFRNDLLIVHFLYT